MKSKIDVKAIRSVIDKAENGYLGLAEIAALMDAAGIARKEEKEVRSEEEAIEAANKIGYPLVMKVVGPVHKSDVGGVVLNVKDLDTVKKEFNRLIQIPETYAVEICKMYQGTEIFIGASREDKFGHQVLFGLGGIFIEVLKDVQAAIVPVSQSEARSLINNLRGYKILEGVRGQKPVNLDIYSEIIARVSALVQAAPEIAEMDLNPLLGTPEYVIAVDARIRVEK